MDFRELFRILVKEQGSDLIIKAGGCPAMRVQGRVKFVSETPVPDVFAQALADKVIPERLTIVVVGPAKTLQAPLEEIAPVTLVPGSES